MPALLDMAVENHVRDYMRSDKFKAFFVRHLRWALQGYSNGMGGEEREAFTQTVARRIRSKARSHRVMLLGLPLWRARYSLEWCREQADEMVTEFIRDEKIKFGDAGFDWSDGADIADDNMSHWEVCQ